MILLTGPSDWLFDATLFIFLVAAFATIGYAIGPKRLEVFLPLLGPLFGTDPEAFVSDRAKKNRSAK
jgi:hypothetical protein